LGKRHDLFPASLPAAAEGAKVAAATAGAVAEGEARVAAKEAKEAAEAKASLEPKSGKAKAAKSEAEGAAAPAKAGLLLLGTDRDVFPKHEYRTKAKPDADPIKDVTFRDKQQNCTQTYDHTHSVTNPSGD
jgi:hypothetical protein